MLANMERKSCKTALRLFQIGGIQEMSIRPLIHLPGIFSSWPAIIQKIIPEDLKLYNSRLQWVGEPGAFFVYIGASSQECKKAKFDWIK